jgi:hypothetical protein
MLWLLKRVLFVWLGLLILCPVGLVVGRLDQTPNELQTLGFDLCDGKPCFMEITPGVTTWDDAKAIFMRNKAERAPWSNAKTEELSFRIRNGLSASVAAWSLPQGLATLVRLGDIAYSPGVSSVGNFIGQYGSPRCIALLHKYSYFVELYYSAMTLVLFREDARLTSSTLILEIYLENPAPRPTNFSCSSYNAYEVRTVSDWRGFASWDRP